MSNLKEIEKHEKLKVRLDSLNLKALNFSSCRKTSRRIHLRYDILIFSIYQ